MKLCGVFRKPLLQKANAEIADADNGGGHFNELAQIYCEFLRRKHVIGVRGEAKINSKKSLYPVERPGRHSSEVRMDAANSKFLQVRSEPGRLIESQKIGLPPPLFNRGDNRRW